MASYSPNCPSITSTASPFLPFKVWDAIISQASKNVEFLKDLQAVKQLGNILKTNVRACKALGHPYVHQLGKIYLDMLNVYKVSMCFIRGMHKLVWLVIEDHLENHFASLCIGHVGEHQLGHFLARGERDEAVVDPLDADGEEEEG